MNVFFKTILVVLFGLSLSACGGGGGSSSGGTTPTPPTDPTDPTPPTDVFDGVVVNYQKGLAGMAGYKLEAGVDVNDAIPNALESYIFTRLQNHTYGAGVVDKWLSDDQFANSLLLGNNGPVLKGTYPGTGISGANGVAMPMEQIAISLYWDDITGDMTTDINVATHVVASAGIYAVNIPALPANGEDTQSVIAQASVVIEVQGVTAGELDGTPQYIEYITQTAGSASYTWDDDYDAMTPDVALLFNNFTLKREVAANYAVSNGVATITDLLDQEYVNMDTDLPDYFLDIDWFFDNGVLNYITEVHKNKRSQYDGFVNQACAIISEEEYMRADVTAIDANAGNFEIKIKPFQVTHNGTVHDYTSGIITGDIVNDTADNVNGSVVIYPLGADRRTVAGVRVMFNCGN